MGRHAAGKASAWAGIWDTVKSTFTDEKRRKSVYTLATAVLGVAAAYGMLTAEEAAQYGESVMTLLGALATVLARANTVNSNVSPALQASNDVLVIEAMDEDPGDDA